MPVMSIMSRYIIRQVSGPLLAAALIGLTALLAERMVRLLDIALGKSDSLAIIFKMLADLIPHYLGLAIPGALFIGLLFGFNRLSKNGEIDAFLAAGIGLHRLTRPVFALACTLMLAAFFVFGWLQPHARYAYRALLYTVKNIDVFYLAEEGVFMKLGKWTFILDTLKKNANVFEHIFLFEDNGERGSETITAERGALIETPGKQRPLLRLENGRRLKIRPLSPAQKPLAPVTSRFKTAEVPIGRRNFSLFRDRGKDRRELTLPELVNRLDDPPAKTTRNEMRAELHKRLVNILSLPILPFLAIPFALARRRAASAYRFGAAIVILVGYYEIVEQAALLVQTGQVSPYVALWTPFALLGVFSAWRYCQASRIIPTRRSGRVAGRSGT